MNFHFSTPLTLTTSVGDIRIAPLSPDVAELRFVDAPSPNATTLRNDSTMTSQTGRMYLARGQRYSIVRAGETVAFFDVGSDGWTIFS